MPRFTASARAKGDDRHGDVMRMVGSAYDVSHAIIPPTEATLRHNHRTRWRQKLPRYELMRSSVIERPENCVLTPASGRFANIHNGNYYGADADANLYLNAVN